MTSRFTVRLPESLHNQLVQLAEDEGTTLNQLIVALLAGATRYSGPTPPDEDTDTATPESRRLA